MGKKRGSATKGGGQKGQQQTKQGFLAGPRKFAREVQGELKRVTGRIGTSSGRARRWS